MNRTALIEVKLFDRPQTYFAHMPHMRKAIEIIGPCSPWTRQRDATGRLRRQNAH
jgi:hypothetical protein